MISLTILFLLSFATLISGQSNASDSPIIQIEAIEAHFSNAGIVPTLLPAFAPVATLAVSFPGVDFSPGKSLTQDQVKPTPSLSVTPANSSITFSGNYTLIMADAGPVGTDESQGQTRHWLVNGVQIPGSSSPFNVSTDSALAVTEYAGPAPAPGSGAHRYVIMLYQQPSNFSAPANLTQANIGVSVFNLEDYVTSSNLGSLIAANYFTVEEGSASVTPSATSPVVTSTLSVPSSSVSSISLAAPTQSGKSSKNGSASIMNMSITTLFLPFVVLMVAAVF